MNTAKWTQKITQPSPKTFHRIAVNFREAICIIINSALNAIIAQPKILRPIIARPCPIARPCLKIKSGIVT